MHLAEFPQLSSVIEQMTAPPPSLPTPADSWVKAAYDTLEEIRLTILRATPCYEPRSGSITSLIPISLTGLVDLRHSRVSAPLPSIKVRHESLWHLFCGSLDEDWADLCDQIYIHRYREMYQV